MTATHLHFLIAFVIGGGGVLLGVLSAQTDPLTLNQWLLAMVTGLVTGAKDLQSRLAEPPH